MTGEQDMLLKRLLSKSQASFLSDAIDESGGGGGGGESGDPMHDKMNNNNKENPHMDGLSAHASSLSKSMKDDIILRALLNTSDLEPQVLQLESVFELNRTRAPTAKPTTGSQVRLCSLLCFIRCVLRMRDF